MKNIILSLRLSFILCSLYFLLEIVTKSFLTKQNYIFKVIKKYYDFYVQNGRFASSKLFENKIEKQIANDYESLNYSEKYYNKNAIYYNNIINDIKKYN